METKELAPKPISIEALDSISEGELDREKEEEGARNEELHERNN